MPFATSSLSLRTSVMSTLAVAAVLLLSTGCAPELAGGGSGAGGSDSNSSNGNNGSDGNGSEGDDKEGTGSSTANLTGQECLPGDWLFDNDSFEKFLGSLSGTFDIDVSGTATLTLRADGTNQTDYDQWKHDVSVQDGRSILVRHGVDKGTYTASADGAMSMTETSVGSISTMTINAGGQVINTAMEPEPSIFSQARYACAGDRLEIEVDGYTALMLRQR